MDIDKLANAMCPIEDELVEDELVEEQGAHDVSNVKPLKSPAAPSRQEMLEHSITHYPFRSWCAHCVRGKSKASKHVATGNSESSETPIVGFDYGFLSDRGRKRDDAQEEDDEVGDVTLKVLVGHDSKSKACAAIPVPQKGVDAEEWSVRENLKFMDFLGYQKVIIKNDQEEALNAVIRKVRQYRGSDTQSMQEHSPVGSSQSNGATHTDHRRTDLHSEERARGSDWSQTRNKQSAVCMAGDPCWQNHHSS